MRPIAFLAVIIACFAAPMAQAAGFRFIDIPADANGPALTGAVWSPCAAPPQEIKFRFVTIHAVRNCPVVGDKLPLIVVSHGSGGWSGANRDTAAMLADAGFVVAALDHPGDNATDHSRSDSLSILLDRPADIRRVTDFMLDAWPEASKLDRERIGFFGFSRSARGGDGVLPEDGAMIDRSLPAKPDYHVVPNSAHFAFMAPCSAEATRALPEICADAGAFDRVAFHKEFNAAVLGFFHKHLIGK